MVKQQTVLAKKRRGPAPTGKGHTIGVRIHDDQLTALDTWRAKQPGLPTRPEAIRRIIARVLKVGKG